LYVFEFFDVDNIVTLKSGSEVTQTDTMGKLGCGFLFVFHSRPNYGSIVHHFPDKARYWSKIVIFFIPLTVDAAVRGGGGVGYCRPKTRMAWLPDGEKL